MTKNVEGFAGLLETAYKAYRKKLVRILTIYPQYTMRPFLMKKAGNSILTLRNSTE